MTNVNRFMMIPYVEGGRDFAGCDCYGWGWLYNRTELGIELPLHPGITAGSPEASEAFAAGQDKWPEVEQGHVCDGDAVGIRERGEPLHVGWIAFGGRLVHMPRPRNGEQWPGVVCTSLQDPDLKHRLLGIHRYPGAGAV